MIFVLFPRDDSLFWLELFSCHLIDNKKDYIALIVSDEIE